MITNVTLRNFKAFLSQEFPLRNLNLITGLNGSGKSSFIQALLMLRQSWDKHLLHAGGVALNGEYVNLGRFQEVLFEAAEDESIGVTIEEEGKESLSWEVSFTNRDARTGLSKLHLTAAAVLRSLFADGFCFLSAERNGPRVHYGVPDRAVPSAGLGIHGEWAVNLLQLNAETLIQCETCSHPLARSLQLPHQVEAWMGEISPGVQLHLSTEPALDLVQVAYSFVARRNTSSRHRPTNIGFGISYVLPVVTAILAAGPGDLLIIESPEAHLHPRGQNKLAELCCKAAKAGVQLILESHSDHILNGIRVGVHDNLIAAEQVQVFYFRWDPDQPSGGTNVSTVQIDTDGRISYWPNGFFDEFDRSLESLLAPKVPVVE